MFPPTARPQKQRPARPQNAFVGENTICSVVFPLKKELESSDECFFACGEGDNICRKAARAEKRRKPVEKVPNPCENGLVGMNQFQFVPLRGEHSGKIHRPGWKVDESAEGNLVFDPDKDKNGNAVIEKNGGGTVKQDGGKTIRFDRIPGYLYTDKGSKVRAYKNLTDDKDLQTNCIGTTFADGEYWIEPDSAGNNNVELILKDDGYTEISRGNGNLNQLKFGDKVIFRNCSNKIHHAAIFLNASNGTVNVLSKNGGRPKGEMSLYKSALPDSATWSFFRK